jgi:hypothetical protein
MLIATPTGPPLVSSRPRCRIRFLPPDRHYRCRQAPREPPVKSTRRRLLPGPSLVVCRAIASVNLCQPAHTHLQPSPTPTTPSSTSSLGSSRSNRQFTLHILPHRPGHISNPRSHEEDACFLIPTTKMRSYLCPPRVRHDHLARAVQSTDTRQKEETVHLQSRLSSVSPLSVSRSITSEHRTSGFSLFLSSLSSTKVYLLCKNRLRFCCLKLFSASIDQSFCFPP